MYPNYNKIAAARVLITILSLILVMADIIFLEFSSLNSISSLDMRPLNILVYEAGVNTFSPCSTQNWSIMLEALIPLRCLIFNISTRRSTNPAVANNVWSPFWYTKSDIVIKTLRYYCFISGCCFKNIANLPNIYVRNMFVFIFYWSCVRVNRTFIHFYSTFSFHVWVFAMSYRHFSTPL